MLQLILRRKFSSTLTIAEVLSERLTGKNIRVQGWVRHLRNHKQIVFCKLVDGVSPEDLQLVISDKQALEVPQLRVGAAVEVFGSLVLSSGRGQRFDFIPLKINIIGEFASHDENLFPLAGRNASDPNVNRQYLHLRPKVPSFGAFLRLRSAAKSIIHEFFQSRKFVEIDTPMFTASDCEGAGESFYVEPSNKSIYAPKDEEEKVEEEGEEENKHFFGKPTFLTVSGQLHLETCAAAMKNVYTFGPTFRAESSKTRQHLAEFHMVEAELAFVDDLEVLLSLVEDLYKFCLSELLKRHETDFKTVLAFHNEKHLIGLQALLNNHRIHRISYSDAAELLLKARTKFKYEFELGRDLGKEHEKFLVRHFGNLPIFVINYPASVKPFYMKQTEDGFASCFDLLTPLAGEVCGGSIREDNYDELYKRLEVLKLTDRLKWYCDLRKLGYPRLGGFGLGFERYLQSLIGANNIKDCIPFPRWYKHCSL